MTAPDLIWVIVGTRPECIKQAPVYKALARRAPKSVLLVGTGQHRELLNDALRALELTLAVGFDVMKPGQPLADLMAHIILEFRQLADRIGAPRSVIVQGDTTTATAVALAAFQMGIEVIHNEAGLRTHDLANPFPEEANRCLISVVASIHFAPTDLARRNLEAEGVLPHKIHVVGNTGIDSLMSVLDESVVPPMDWIRQNPAPAGTKTCLLTAHRREARGQPFELLFEGLRDFLRDHPQYRFVYPTHPNQLGSVAAERVVDGLQGQLVIVPPMDYVSLVHLLKSCSLVVTDSGGIQEEAATLGIPTVVCRELTERREAVELGIAVVVGLDRERISVGLSWAADRQHETNAWRHRPYGDGNAGEKIASIVLDRLGHTPN